MSTNLQSFGISAAPSSGGSGDVVGPASSTDNALARFDGTTGKLLQNSTVLCDDSGNLTGVGTINAVKIYRALLTQSGTDAPVATVLENTLGGTVVWTRDNAGRYDATLAGAFTANKTLVNSGACMNNGNTMLGWFAAERTDADVLRLITTATSDATALADDVLTATFVQILVYP